MNETIHRLREIAATRGVAHQEVDEVFDLLSAACSMCCDDKCGGNGSCGPDTCKEEPGTVLTPGGAS